ncbi:MULTISPECIES: hypothetical protein [unclassified Yoonia]|uniref:hypothetical protein n=1 Tax=unclassified Yoonia TaxID=2629118 RepID=UPI002AFF3F87|nr:MULTISPECIES: hypothetical protein [unclassified Yoonia]
MMLVRAGVFIVAAGLANVAAASCTDDPFLTCTTGGKTLSLCLGEGTATYTFLQAGSPELVLARPISEVDYVAWSGFGRYPTNQVVFRNHSYNYVITSVYDRHEDGERPYEVTILVERDDRIVARLSCRETFEDDPLTPIWRAKEAAGQCWKLETRDWHDDCKQ